MNQEQNNRTIKTNQITEGVIWQQLLLFSFPISLGTFSQQLYNTMDAIVVGRFVGKEALTAVGGPTGTLTNLLAGAFVGLSSGMVVITSQYYGAKKADKVDWVIHISVASALSCGGVMMVLGIAGASAALRTMGTPEEIMEYTFLYLRIYFVGIISSLIYNMGSGAPRAAGDSRRPLYPLMASCFTNTVLDILFVVVLRMGVMGAALAMILPQTVSAIPVVVVLTRVREIYQLKYREIRINKRMLKRIIQIGLPATLQSAMYSSSNTIIQASVNRLGTGTVAAWTAHSKIDSLFRMIINAFGISITTFVGQNYGAGYMDRVKRGIRVCLGMSVAAALGLTVLPYVFGHPTFTILTDDVAALEKGMEILRFPMPMFITYVVIEIYSGVLRGVGDCWIPMLITCPGICALRVLWILVVVPLQPAIKTVPLSHPSTWATTSILFLIYFHRFSRSRGRGQYVCN